MGKAKAEKVDRRKDIAIVEHELSLEEVYQKHNVRPDQGLSTAQVQELRAKYGYNRLTPAERIPAWLLYVYQYTNFFSILLIAGGILCFIAYGLDQSDASNLYLGIVLEAVVFISSTFSYIQEAKSNAIMQGFKAMVPKRSKAIRDGAAVILDASELVPGDMVEFQEGDQVPADVRVTEAYNLKVDNSSLTGESEALERKPELEEVHGHSGKTPAVEATNLLFFSTIITSGHGKGIVVGTGDNTFMGQIAGLTGESGTGDTTPPLIREVNTFIKYVSVIAILLGITFLGVGIGLGVQTVVQALVFCISVIVATVPEGLLVTLTVALALTAKRMHARNMLVKNLQGVETLGCTTVIASDKTGTLTQNRMTVQHCWYDAELHDVPAPRNLPEFKQMMANREERGSQGWTKYDPDNSSFHMLHKVATICNNSEFILANNLDPAAGLLDLGAEWQKPDFNLLNMGCTGDASESGLLKMVQAVRDAKSYRAAMPKLFEIKFNSTNKWQLSVHTDTEAPAGAPPVLLLKGAPEKVWARCTHILHNGREEPITLEWADKFQAAYNKLGSLGERVLGFAYKNLHGLPHNHPWSETPSCNFPTEGLVFAGLLSLMDPPRLGVPEAVEKCKLASVRVYMVTGDHPITARAIAHDIGILDRDAVETGKGIVCTGDDIRIMEELPEGDVRIAAWDKVLAHEQIVFARVTPAHKLQIVEHNQRHGHIVAVTGDGVNDAPALKRANIGLSMGIAGKDVSKEAADMILMDDNFASIVNGVEEGRLIFDNLKKSIMYTLTSKPPELLPFILWVAARFPLAISTILILAIDLGTDMLPAIMLAYETKESALMLRPPRNANRDHLVDVPLLHFTYLHFGIIQVCAGLFAFMVAMNDWGYPPHVLLGRGIGWSRHPLLCVDRDGDGKVDHCGFGCGEPQNQGSVAAQLRTAYPELAIPTEYCADGCFSPPDGAAWDPFVEFTPGGGFRGFAAGAAAVCGRSCAWYNSLSTETKNTWLAAAATGTGPLSKILTSKDDDLFQQYCAAPQSELFGFPGRDVADTASKGEIGSSYWWGAAFQAAPNLDYQTNALRASQTAYFVAVVLGKAMTAIVSKTRRLSVFQHGIMNNKLLLGAIAFELCLAVLLAYVPPLNTVFSTMPIPGLHWLLGIPWMLFLFCYDELRKLIIRRSNGGYFDKLLFW